MTAEATTKAGSERYSIPTEAELIQRANDLIPFLRSRADEIDHAGSVPEDVIDRLRNAGLFKILQPVEWGGYGLTPITFMRVLMELARGGSSGSAAWVYMVLGAHQATASALPEVAEEIWGKDPTTLVSSSYVPAGKCQKVDGGYIISGTWPTSSGCLNAKWAVVGAMGVGPNGGDVDHLGFFTPLSMGKCNDDWYTLGLQGTASRSVTFEEVFVPNHRVMSFTQSRTGVPFWLGATTIINSITIGFGQSAIDVCLELLQGKKRSYGSTLLTEDPRIQEKLGRAQAIVNRCRSRLEWVYERSLEEAAKGNGIPDMMLANMMDVSNTGQQIQEAVVTLYNIVGPSVVARKNTFERVFRDTFAASAHPQARFEDEPVELGQQLLANYRTAKAC